MAFNDWYDCEIVDLDSGGAIALDAEYTSLVIDFESREVAWREDTSTLPPPTKTGTTLLCFFLPSSSLSLSRPWAWTR